MIKLVHIEVIFLIVGKRLEILNKEKFIEIQKQMPLKKLIYCILNYCCKNTKKCTFSADEDLYIYIKMYVHNIS